MLPDRLNRSVQNLGQIYRVILDNLFSFEQMLPDRSELICSESWSDLILDILIILYKRYLIRTSKILDLCSDQIR